MKTLRTATLSLLALSLTLIACKKDCEDDVITAKGLAVNGQQEVPPRDTKASGVLDVSYNKRTKILTYKVAWQGLTGNPVGAHIHGEAPRGVNAGIKHDFTAPIPKTTIGMYSGSVAVDEVAIKEAGLLGGLYYVNIHTPAFPGGEIRGQIEFD